MSPQRAGRRVAGTEGRSTGEKRTTRPRLVRAPISARTVVSTVVRIASCLLRRAGTVSSCPSPRSTPHGAARGGEDKGRGGVGDLQIDRSLGRSWLRGSGVHQKRTARCAVGIGPQHRAPWRPRRQEPPGCRAAHGARRSPPAAHRARSRARCVRTWSGAAVEARGCTRPAARSDRTPSADVRACSESSEERMTWMTSSMSRIAMSKPSTR